MWDKTTTCRSHITFLNEKALMFWILKLWHAWRAGTDLSVAHTHIHGTKKKRDKTNLRHGRKLHPKMRRMCQGGKMSKEYSQWDPSVQNDTNTSCHDHKAQWKQRTNKIESSKQQKQSFSDLVLLWESKQPNTSQATHHHIRERIHQV